MLDDKPVQVGDNLVELGRVYRVFKIADKTSFSGKEEKHIFFEPVYETVENRTLSCSIPMKNISSANIRRPVDKKTIREVFALLASGEYQDVVLDLNVAKDILRLNDIFESARVLRAVWEKIIDEENPATKSTRDIFDLSKKRLAQEVALAYDIDLEKAEKKLDNELKKTIDKPTKRISPRSL
jgi:RNA polymerase-interacting CarD/CdnL/TRCF family regulator